MNNDPLERLTDVSRRERYARWMLLNLDVESRRDVLARYFRVHGPVASIELKQALLQEEHRLDGMTDHEKHKLALADNAAQQEVLAS